MSSEGRQLTFSQLRTSCSTWLGSEQPNMGSFHIVQYLWLCR